MAPALVRLRPQRTSTPGDAPNLEKWVAEVKARPAPPLDPLPVMQQFETFEYAAQSLRDPFSNAFSDHSGGSGPRPDPNRPQADAGAVPARQPGHGRHDRQRRRA